MDGPDHYRAGKRWLDHAEQAHQQMVQRPGATAREVSAATEIANTHFLAAQIALSVHRFGDNLLADRDWKAATKTRGG